VKSLCILFELFFSLTLTAQTLPTMPQPLTLLTGDLIVSVPNAVNNNDSLDVILVNQQHQTIASIAAYNTEIIKFDSKFGDRELKCTFDSIKNNVYKIHNLYPPKIEFTFAQGDPFYIAMLRYFLVQKVDGKIIYQRMDTITYDEEFLTKKTKGEIVEKPDSSKMWRKIGAICIQYARPDELEIGIGYANNLYGLGHAFFTRRSSGDSLEVYIYDPFAKSKKFSIAEFLRRIRPSDISEACDGMVGDFQDILHIEEHAELGYDLLMIKTWYHNNEVVYIEEDTGAQVLKSFERLLAIPVPH